MTSCLYVLNCSSHSHQVQKTTLDHELICLIWIPLHSFNGSINHWTGWQHVMHSTSLLQAELRAVKVKPTNSPYQHVWQSTLTWIDEHHRLKKGETANMTSTYHPLWWRGWCWSSSQGWYSHQWQGHDQCSLPLSIWCQLQSLYLHYCWV